MNRRNNIYRDIRVSSSFCIIVILALSVFVAWYSLEAAKNILDNSQNSPVLHTSKLIKKEKLN